MSLESKFKSFHVVGVSTTALLQLQPCTISISVCSTKLCTHSTHSSQRVLLSRGADRVGVLWACLSTGAGNSQ